MWSDPDLKPYMAITGHWMELDSLNKLTLRAALLGFLHVPGSHSGESLAQAFWFTIGPMKVETKVSVLLNLLRNLLTLFKFGWVTTDNAANNSTMMENLEASIRKGDPNTSFSRGHNHIR